MTRNSVAIELVQKSMVHCRVNCSCITLVHQGGERHCDSKLSNVHNTTPDNTSCPKPWLKAKTPDAQAIGPTPLLLMLKKCYAALIMCLLVMFFLQIAGALAEDGKSLEEITQVAKSAAQAMGL